MRAARGDDRVRLAGQMVAISAAAAAQWRAEHPGDPLPQHPGFERVAIAAGLRRDWTAVLAACDLAQREGWAGNWAHRAARAERALSAFHVPRETK